MRSKSGILLIVALGCGMVASVGISQVVAERQASDNQIQLVEILVATRDIDVQEKITADNIRLEKWPKDRLPEGAITKLEDVENRFANQRLFAGEPLLPAKLMDSAESVANKIPPGHRVFDMSVDNNTGGMGYILPGDRVDVIGFFQGSQPGQVGQTQTVLRAVRVFGIDGNTIRDNKKADEKKAATTIQLLIQDSQLEAMTTASAMGQLRVSLCPPGVNTGGENGEKVDTGAAFMSWIKNRNTPLDAGTSRTGASTLEALGALFARSQAPTIDPQADKASTEVAVITPRGVTRYSIGKEGEIPRMIDSTMPAGGTMGASPSNTPSFGGFPVNYPPSSNGLAAPGSMPSGTNPGAPFGSSGLSNLPGTPSVSGQ
jgi:Flp pilus assembly protein CpaB